MKANSPINETRIANALVAILERLERLEEATNILAGQRLAKAPEVSKPAASQPLTAEHAVLLKTLERLTFKRHAVLTATLGGVSYQTLSQLMDCDPTTIKLQLKGALNVLGFKDRALLLATSPKLLDFIHDAHYQARFGISKRWWLVQAPEVMNVLRMKKPARNQHTKPRP
jgi:hypothetical protein